jgi:hypothetical protein
VTRVYLEVGAKKAFACAVDWPGWCRAGRTEEAALEALLAYAPRYAEVAGPSFAPGGLVVVGRLPGTATTEFGAPDARGPWDDEPLVGDEADRQAGLLEASWALLDRVVSGAPASLRKGPRGGGRDRDAVAAHVQESERSYGRSLGVRVPPRTPWPEQRAALAETVRAGVSGTSWPPRYGVRRIAWHVLDHAWEIEDRSDP